MGSLEAPGTLQLADRERDRDADQHSCDEQVLERPERSPLSDQRDVEVVGEDGSEGFYDGRKQHDEAPEDEEVHDARQGPLQELALPEDDD
jgi:hypothetical protein